MTENKIAPLLSKGDVAKYLGVSQSTLERHIRKGLFPSGFRLPNGHLRWTQEVVSGEIEKLQSEAKSA